jgi:hypothetical protein
MGGPYVTDPPKPAPFYTVGVTADFDGGEHHVIFLYVPSARRVAGVGEAGGLEWFAVEASRARMLDSATADVRPYQGGAWPRGLKSVERISALAGASVPSASVPSGGFPTTYVLAAMVAGGAFAAAGLLLLQRRFTPRGAHPRPALIGRTKTPLHLLVAIVAALALAASAQAKGEGLTKAAIWGASGSVTLDDPAQMSLLPGAAGRRSDPPELAPFYTIDVRLGLYRPAQHVLMLWVPSARRVATVGVMGDVEWFPVGAARARMLDAALADVEPYQPGRAWPPRLRSVEQISSPDGASVAAPVSTDAFPWAYLLAAVFAGGGFVASGLLLRRRRLSRAAPPRPA